MKGHAATIGRQHIQRAFERVKNRTFARHLSSLSGCISNGLKQKLS
jgi:hypothetical protein